jgi:hypothetical protein
MNLNKIRRTIHLRNHQIIWEAEGVESSVGLACANGLAFKINGRTDGHAIVDASTQIGSGLISSFLHPRPVNGMVIGLGTGSTAGWMAAIESINVVDVVELEPSILEVARQCRDVNNNVLKHPKINVIIGDGREILLTSKKKYDVIVSEPSNPYRAGIASLYTLEFYRAAADCMTENGIFTKWVQAYEVDTLTVRTIYATLSSVFPYVYTWQTNPWDMILICTKKEINIDAAMLRKRLKTEPFKSGFEYAWQVEDLEGYLAHYTADPQLAKLVASRELSAGGPRINVDDRMLVEYGFARTVGKKKGFFLEDLHQAARSRSYFENMPVKGEIDNNRILYGRAIMFLHANSHYRYTAQFPEAFQQSVAALWQSRQGEHAKALAAWDKAGRKPSLIPEYTMLAQALADKGDPGALHYIKKLREKKRVEAPFIHALLKWKQGKADEAIFHLQTGFEQLRIKPWGSWNIIKRALDLSVAIAKENKAHASQLVDLLDQPFSTKIGEDLRRLTALDIAKTYSARQAADIVASFEPYVPWTRPFLQVRAQIYRRVNSPLKDSAEADLRDFINAMPLTFEESLSQFDS